MMDCSIQLELANTTHDSDNHLLELRWFSERLLIPLRQSVPTTPLCPARAGADQLSSTGESADPRVPRPCSDLTVCRCLASHVIGSGLFSACLMLRSPRSLHALSIMKCFCWPQEDQLGRSATNIDDLAHLFPLNITSETLYCRFVAPLGVLKGVWLGLRL